MITVTLCMGSSCFSRGNAAALDSLEDFVSKKKLEDRIKLMGRHCMGGCSQGPVVQINGRQYNNLQPEDIIHIVEMQLEKENVD